jgi:hypothetical protein
MKPEEALTFGYPSVAATWNPDRNGDRTPHNARVQVASAPDVAELLAGERNG